MVKTLVFSIVILTLLLSFCASATESSEESEEEQEEGREYADVIITTALGKVRGTYLTSSSGRIFYAFRGIRYAKPPIEDLRFKAPEPIDQWNGIFDATQDGPMCPQPTVNLSDISEDCLRINIYSHTLPTEESGIVRKPVIVYLHPGGFYSVSGQSWNFAGPLYLMDRNIVLVTINYRLGSLGFMSTGTPEAPGNLGLKDQVMALKWIKLHIARFGGDPNSVTLLGYSAGGVSVTLHMISPMSRNLFHKAIVMSGSSTGHARVGSHQIHLAKRQARLLNCTDERTREMMDCLMTKDATDFGTTLDNMFENENPISLFSPVVEPDFGQERFLIEDPIEAYQRGRFMKIPIIAGVTKDEFAQPAIWALKNNTLRKQMDSDFSIWAPIKFSYEKDTRRSNDISLDIREFYFGRNPLSLNGSLDGLVKLYGDALTGFGIHRFVHLAARYTRVYRYCFTYQGRFSHIYYPKDDTPYGVVHQDDLLYLFTSPFVAPIFTENDPERTTVERLTRMWAAFAYKGDPNKPIDEYLHNIRWRPFGLRREQYLEIGKKLIMKDRLNFERYNLWRDLFPLQWPPGRRDRMQENGENDEFNENYPEPVSSEEEN